MLPAGYRESRDRFNVLAKERGAETHRFLHGDAVCGDAKLSTDTAYFGRADAPTVVIVSSGTHGVEGYAGAACQFRFMENYDTRYARNDIAYLLVHAVNPWGYLHDRRVTQEGVDLNRNFVDFPVITRANSGYAAYHDRLVSNYHPLPSGLWNELRLLSGALTLARRKLAQAAITAGQYEFPDGLFFGGFAPTRSRVVWENIVRTCTRGRRRAVLLDIHTGLGKRGVGELISYRSPTSNDFQRMATWFQDGLKSMMSGDSVSAALEGDLTAGFDRIVDAESYAIGIEFGTCAPLVVLNAMRADHWYHNNAARLSDKQRDAVRIKMKHAFAPDDPQWFDQITARFEQVMDQLLAGVSKQ